MPKAISFRSLSLEEHRERIRELTYVTDSVRVAESLARSGCKVVLNVQTSRNSDVPGVRDVEASDDPERLGVQTSETPQL